MFQLFLSADVCPWTCLPSGLVSVTETIVPLSTLTTTGSPGGTSCAPPAGVTVSFAGCAVGAGACVGPPPEDPLADTVGSLLLHAPSASTATKPNATAAPRRRVEVLTVTPIPLCPFGATPLRDVPRTCDVEQQSRDEGHNGARAL